MAKALVLYHSQAQGNTTVLAEAIAAGLKDGGCDIDVHNTNEGRFDISKYPQYDCVAFGSPDYYSYIAGGLKMFLDDHFIANFIQKGQGYTNKSFILFYTHGKGGKVKEVIKELFKGMGTQVGEPVGCEGKPAQNIIDKARALGKELAKSL